MTRPAFGHPPAPRAPSLWAKQCLSQPMLGRRIHQELVGILATLIACNARLAPYQGSVHVSSAWPLGVQTGPSMVSMSSLMMSFSERGCMLPCDVSCCVSAGIGYGLWRYPCFNRYFGRPQHFGRCLVTICRVFSSLDLFFQPLIAALVNPLGRNPFFPAQRLCARVDRELVHLARRFQVIKQDRTASLGLAVRSCFMT